MEGRTVSFSSGLCWEKGLPDAEAMAKRPDFAGVPALALDPSFFISILEQDKNALTGSGSDGLRQDQ